jgi:hypothetical protein
MAAIGALVAAHSCSKHASTLRRVKESADHVLMDENDVAAAGDGELGENKLLRGADRCTAGQKQWVEATRTARDGGGCAESADAMRWWSVRDAKAAAHKQETKKYREKREEIKTKHTRTYDWAFMLGLAVRWLKQVAKAQAPIESHCFAMNY